VEGENIIEMYSKTRAAGFGPEVKRRIMLGTYALSSGYYDAYYLKALKVRRLLKEDYDKAFEQVDVIATPTAPTPAFKFGRQDGRPLVHVPGRRVHHLRQHRGGSGFVGALRFLQRRGCPSASS
jgi:Asp-tRNA(Asn)/Glu-tRNA(Gln) amidotransferase A subunit family amidase